MKIDISNARFDRRRWADFLNRCKGTISTEAGSWFLEKDDATVEAIRSYVYEQTSGILIANDSRLWILARALPLWVRRKAKWTLGALGVGYETLINEAQSYSDIHTRFFKDKPRPPIYGKCISSRHFEAIGTKTCQIMFRARFNDILNPDLRRCNFSYCSKPDIAASLSIELRRDQPCDCYRQGGTKTPRVNECS